VPRTIPEEGGYFRLGDLSETYYTLKYRFSGRLGLKYYFIGTSEKPIHNFFVGAFINSNLGQADFTEIAIGYTKQLTARSK
jgi:seryl-tRNA synthetase